MPYYHATWRRHLTSILKHGLGGAVPDARNFPVEMGVYLARNLAVSVAFMIESYLEHGDTVDLTPMEVVNAICILVIDDSRVSERLMSADPNIDRTDMTVLYRGIIDVAGMPILNVEDVINSPFTMDKVVTASSTLLRRERCQGGRSRGKRSWIEPTDERLA